MIKSKAWDWSKNESTQWLIPAIESCYLSESWEAKGFNKFLDLGCGLGRHSIYFARKGFEVSSVDLSDFGVNHLKIWAQKEGLDISTDVCDMLNLPFASDAFDCIIAYNVIYHTDTQGFIKSLEEIKRVLRNKGELFITLLSKNSLTYQSANQSKHIDSNTILRDDDDTERNVPHFYVDIEDIKKYFIGFDFINIPVEQTEYNINETQKVSKHFNLILKKQ